MLLEVAQVLQQIFFLLSTQNHIYAFDMGHSIRLQLCITSRHYHKGTRMLLHQPMNGLTALFVSHFGHRTGIYYANISLFSPSGRTYSGFLQHLADSGRFRKVQLAAQRIIDSCLILKYIGINHNLLT